MNIVTTNLRIPHDDWEQAKVVAQDMGMSLNQYLNWLVTNASTNISLGSKVTDLGKKRHLKLIDLAKEADKIPNQPDSGFSNDDQIIYEL